MNLGSRGERRVPCHINNDLYVAPNWNGFLIEAMERHRLDAASPLGLEMMPTASLTDWMQGSWAAIGQGRLSSGKGIDQLRTMIQAMYGDWERYCGEAHHAFAGTMLDGIVGSCVMVRRSTYDALGGLDERIQSADWDLYYTLRKREQVVGDVKRCMVVGARSCIILSGRRSRVSGSRLPAAMNDGRSTGSGARPSRLSCGVSRGVFYFVLRAAAHSACGETCEKNGSGIGSRHGLAPALDQSRSRSRSVPQAV